MAPKSHVVLAAASLLLTRCFVAADCNVSSNYTIIDNPDDSDGISSCSSIDGSLSLLLDNDPGAWSSEKAAIDLGSIGSVDGELVIYPDAQHKKTVITAKKLKTIDGELDIWNTDASSTIKSFELSFPALEEVTSNYVLTGGFAAVEVTHSDSLQVGGMMRIYTTTDLETLSFGGLHTVQGDFSVDSNEDLKELEVGTLTTAEKAFSIQENPALESMSFPKLKTIKGDMTIYKNTALTYLELSALEYAGTISVTSNGDSPVVYFPELSSLGTGNDSSTSTFKGVSEITFSSLRTVQGAFTFQSTALEDLTIPLIKLLNGSITVEDNPSMTTFALPRVTTVGDIWVDSNDKLTNVTANALKTAGTVSLKGSFTNVEFFGLEEVTGDFKVVGEDSMDCSWFDENVKSIVKGKYTCVGSHDTTTRKSSTGGIEDTEGNPDAYKKASSGNGSSGKNGSGGDDDDDDDNDSDGSSSSEDSDGDSGSGKKGLSSGAQAGIGAGVAVGVVALLAIAGVLLWRRRKQTAATGAAVAPGRRGESRGSDSSSKTKVFDGGQMLGVRTKIEASNPTPSPSPSLGTLSFGRNSFLDSSAEKGMNAWKTIRRVSDSSSGNSQASKS